MQLASGIHISWIKRKKNSSKNPFVQQTAKIREKSEIRKQIFGFIEPKPKKFVQMHFKLP